jgi:hypothetical protein
MTLHGYTAVTEGEGGMLVRYGMAVGRRQQGEIREKERGPS